MPCMVRQVPFPLVEQRHPAPVTVVPRNGRLGRTCEICSAGAPSPAATAALPTFCGMRSYPSHVAGLPGVVLGRSTLLTTMRGAGGSPVDCTGTVVDAVSGAAPACGTERSACTTPMSMGAPPAATGGNESVPCSTRISCGD